MSHPEADIRALYGRVAQKFSELDLEGFRGCFHLPLLLTTREGVRLIADDADFEQVFGGIMQALTKAGFTRSAIERQQIRVFDDATALTSVLWVRYQGEDDILERLGATYTLTRVEGNWRITALVGHAAEDVLNLE